MIKRKSSEEGDMRMKIGEVSEKFAISVDTLRYYEKIGLIDPVPRLENGLRDYDEKAINRIEFILCMRDAGLSIELLQKYFELNKVGDSTIAIRREILAEQRARLLVQMEKMQASLDRLNYKIGTYDQRLADAGQQYVRVDELLKTKKKKVQ